ncbi:IS630 family transposase [Paraburkholderia sp. CNPSo 3157]|uniref:IS630 family transposase n=2 Tax=Paraburkholderia franconis TaxID=2654983 RepID=A0A7X1NJL8_9BURK|nr:IS630 family transposase [Paraburkholderia franconis]
MPAEAQSELRVRVINAVLDGLSQTKAAEVFGVSRWSVNQWMAIHRAGGPKALAPKKRGRRKGEAGKLTPAQCRKLHGWLTRKMPDQLSLPFYLWTRAAIRHLIREQFGVSLSLASVSGYMKRMGFSSQRPVRRAYERNEPAIQAWLKDEYPKIAARARREHAALYWSDETGLRSDDVRGRSFALKGQTPIVRATGKRFGCNVISAITNKGELNFMVFDSNLTNDVFIRFLRRLIKQSRRKVFVIVDRHPVHRSKAVREWLARRVEQIEMFLLPTYAPELNPDELLNADIKRGVGQRRPRDTEALKQDARSWLYHRQHQPQIIARFFEAPHVAYAADGII